MEIERLGPDALRASIKTACDYIELNREILDNLNVYPVPDGDTGVNMLSTLKPAVRELEKAGCASLADLARTMNDMLAKNSRGNSGFILAQFFRGFWEAAVTPGHDWLDSNNLLRGFERGSFTAVSSLLTPVEGTMISVIASMLEALRRLDGGNIVRYLSEALEAGRAALFRTPEQLPLLAEAGVVDAGALGFLFIIRGMLCGILREEIEAENEHDYRFEQRAAAVIESTAGRSGRSRKTEFRYCVELDIETGAAGTGAAQTAVAGAGAAAAEPVTAAAMPGAGATEPTAGRPNEPAPVTGAANTEWATAAAAAGPPPAFVDYLRENGGSIALITDSGRLLIHLNHN